MLGQASGAESFRARRRDALVWLTQPAGACLVPILCARPTGVCAMSHERTACGVAAEAVCKPQLPRIAKRNFVRQRTDRW